MGLTGFVINHVFIASFSPEQGERNPMVNTEFTRPVNKMPMSRLKERRREGLIWSGTDFDKGITFDCRNDLHFSPEEGCRNERENVPLE